MKALLFGLFVLATNAAHAAQTSGTPLAQCFGYQLIQYGTSAAPNFFMRPSDGNQINNGQDLPVYHESVPDLDTFTAILPGGAEFILTRSFELGANMKGQMVYRGSFKWNGHQTSERVCKAL